jgi:hypothetical protein
MDATRMVQICAQLEVGASRNHLYARESTDSLEAEFQRLRSALEICSKPR